MDEHGSLDGVLTNQLTINVPTYTKASLIYRYLMDILSSESFSPLASQSVPDKSFTPGYDGSAARGDPTTKKSKAKRKNKHGQLDQTPGALELDLSKKYRHTDILVQFELRQLLCQEMF